jgi:membrane protein
VARTVKQIARAAGKGLLRHNALGLAAELSYFTFLSLFPFLICLVAFASAVPSINLVDNARRLVAAAAPQAVVDAMVGQMMQLSRSGNIAVIALGLAGALWSGSSALHSLMSGVNRAYGRTDQRRWGSVRMTALWLSMALGLLIAALLVLVAVAPGLTARPPWREHPLRIVVGGFGRWIIVWLAISTAASAVYTVSLDRGDRRRARVVPGAMIAAVFWTVATILLHLYVGSIGSYGMTYGALGGAMFVLLWFYFTNLSVLAGAEVNGELSKT